MAQLLTAPFTQLPVALDPQPLLKEIERLGRSAWIDHRLKNLYSIPLVAIIDNKARWCSAIDKLPKLQSLLHTWNAPIGESRVSILEPGAVVESHVDVDYYWKHRLRVHIVLQTNPKALFGCGNQVLSLPAGQLWVSNNWAPHWISNKGNSDRIHVVIDTVGSPTLWQWVDKGWHSTSQAPIPTCEELTHLPLIETNPQLSLERNPKMAIRTPAQLQEIIDDCLRDMNKTVSIHDRTVCHSQLRVLVLRWRSIYTLHADESTAYPFYTMALTKALNNMPNPIFWNGTDLHTTLKIQVGAPLFFESTR